MPLVVRKFKRRCSSFYAQYATIEVGCSRKLFYLYGKNIAPYPKSGWTDVDDAVVAYRSTLSIKLDAIDIDFVIIVVEDIELVGVYGRIMINIKLTTDKDTVVCAVPQRVVR